MFGIHTHLADLTFFHLHAETLGSVNAALVRPFFPGFTKSDLNAVLAQNIRKQNRRPATAGDHLLFFKEGFDHSTNFFVHFRCPLGVAQV